MEKKELQKQRMRKYFIDATKEILRGEGIHAVSVRNIADRAGYSYATLYNYFKDLREVYIYCIEDYFTECKEFILSQQPKDLKGEVALMSKAKGYMKYFVQYPNIFDLIYLEKTYEISSQDKIMLMVSELFNEVFQEHWEELESPYKISKNKDDFKKQTFYMLLNSLLMYYLNRRQPTTYAQFTNDSTIILEMYLASLKG